MNTPYKKTISDTNEFLKNVANIYQGTMRIFMEYIDNSLDSAETLYNLGQRYPYPIIISVKIDPKNKVVSFWDNCVGMNKGVKDEKGNWKDGLLAIVTNIGNSNKKTVSWLNGQFGFGAHAYMACAKKMSILTTRKDMDHCLHIDLFRDSETVQPERKVPKGKFPYTSGTIVTISDFDKEWWNEITPQLVKEEIEKHFEQLLTRDNLEIKIFYDEGEELCQPFNYDGYLGKKIEKEIAQLTKETHGGQKTRLLETPIKIYLKITDDIIPNKRPIFVNKGRRIEEVQEIKSFRSKSQYRTSLWGHNNLTGFIEVAGLLNPTLPRDDFDRKNLQTRQMIYDEIIKLEDELYKTLQVINNRSENANMNKLEDLLSSALSQLARQDSMRFRTQTVSGNRINLTEDNNSSLKLKIFNVFRKKGHVREAEKVTEKEQTEVIPVVETNGESSLKGKESKKSGFNIKFSPREQKRADGTLMRSHFIEGEGIIIYTSHPEFRERASTTRQGEMKISERLVSYLASEITVHYKDKFFDVKGKQPEVKAISNDRKALFVDIFDFSYKFEKILQQFVGKNLQTLQAAGTPSDDNTE